MTMTNQSTKSWSVVVPVSGRCWLNARHALRNSSEGLYLKKKINSYIYISVSILIKKKFPTLTFTLIFHFSATQTSQLGNFSGSGAFLRNTKWIQPPVKQGWLLNSSEEWAQHIPLWILLFSGDEVRSPKHFRGPWAPPSFLTCWEREGYLPDFGANIFCLSDLKNRKDPLHSSKFLQVILPWRI